MHIPPFAVALPFSPFLEALAKCLCWNHMLPFDPMRPRVILLRLISAGIEVHVLFFVILAAAVKVYPVFWFLIDLSFEEFLGFVERIISRVTGLNLAADD
jgi:hypothetical protein